MDRRGLTESEVKKRFERFGPNELKETNKISPFKIFLRQIKGNYIVYLLFIAGLISFFVGKSITSYTILAVIILVTTTGFIQEYRAEKVINSLKGMLMPVSIVIRNGKEIEVLSRKIVPGDLVVLRNGEKIPADCLLIEQTDLLVNESILTGESKEIAKKIAKMNSNIPTRIMIFMGSFIVNGKCLAKVIETGMSTKFGKIAGMISTAEKELPLQKKINTISKFMVIVAIIFSVLTGVTMILQSPISQTTLVDALILMIALAVSAFPEGFPVVMTTSLSVGAYRMAKQNAIVNRMSIIETLGETTVICSDKTGTITKGEMTVKKIFEDNKLIEVSGTGYEGQGNFSVDGKKFSSENDEILKNLIQCAILCNDSKIERTGEGKNFKILGTPTEASLKVLGAKINLYSEDINFKRIEEIPFSSERKIMTILGEKNKERIIYSKGATEFLIKKCTHIQRKNGIFALTEKEKKYNFRRK
jgi:Ca2+-transporting ATPase